MSEPTRYTPGQFDAQADHVESLNSLCDDPECGGCVRRRERAAMWRQAAADARALEEMRVRFPYDGLDQLRAEIEKERTFWRREAYTARPERDRLARVVAGMREWAFLVGDFGLDGKGRWLECRGCGQRHLFGGTFAAGAQHRAGFGCVIEAMLAELDRLTGEEPPVEATYDAERCEGVYPVPQTAPPREEPFDVMYRCALRKGHAGAHGVAVKEREL